jgi:hypothetical protein
MDISRKSQHVKTSCENPKIEGWAGLAHEHANCVRDLGRKGTTNITDGATLGSSDHSPQAQLSKEYVA